MFDIFEEIVSNWLFLKGYFVVNNLKVGNNEIDMLAVKVTNGAVVEKIHIEIQCSSDPIGYIGGSKSAKSRNAKQVEEGVVEYIDKKFLSKKTRKTVEKLLGEKYLKWFICGKLKDEFTVAAFKKHKIEVKRIWDIIEEYKMMHKDKKAYLRTAQGNRFNQLLILSQKQ